MRDLAPMNEYQQLLYSALALVDEADLLAILRAAGKHPERNSCIELVNAELDKGITLWDIFAAPSPLHVLFTNDRPEFRVSVDLDGQTILLDFGTYGPPSDLLVWEARMGATGVVEKLHDPARYWPEGIPTQPGPAPRGWNRLDDIRLQ